MGSSLIAVERIKAVRSQRMHLRTLTVYLAGPMTGEFPRRAAGWRSDVADQLADFDCLDPMRGRPELDRATTLCADVQDGLLDGKAVVARDLRDIRSADAVLVNLAEARSVSIGTMVELGYARALGRFVVVVLPCAPNPHDHTFVRELADVLVESLDQAIVVLRDL